jgi:hypothetical protein
MVSPAVTSPTANRKKRLLLVDSTPSKRDLRARVLRQMGVEVDCAADISEARALWQADSYNLVLLDVRREPENVEAFCTEIQGSKTPQRIAYLVGKPEYLGALPGIESELAQDVSRGKAIWSEVVASLFIDSCEQLPRRYGFVEASWRIAATRSLKDPRPRNGDAAAKLPWSWAFAFRRKIPVATASTLPPLESYNPGLSNNAVPKKEIL